MFACGCPVLICQDCIRHCCSHVWLHVCLLLPSPHLSRLYKALLFPCVAACLPVVALSSSVKTVQGTVVPMCGCMFACCCPVLICQDCIRHCCSHVWLHVCLLLPSPHLSRLYKALLFPCVAACLPVVAQSSSVRTV